GLPLGPDREVRPAAAPQPRLGDQLPDPFAAQAQRPLQRAVAAGFERINSARLAQESRLTGLCPRAAAGRAGPRVSTVAAERRGLPAIAGTTNGAAPEMGC